MIEAVLSEIKRIQKGRKQVVIAIDGRCASGKTTFAERLNKELSCNVIHMDDFFLQPCQRTAERYDEPGGNIDRERFLTEVLHPLRAGRAFTYSPFDCHTMTFGEPIAVRPKEITVIEGTYSCHPALWEHYDLHIFLTTTPQNQLDRLARRTGADIQMFCNRWIPLEERYFAACKPDVKCEIIFET